MYGHTIVPAALQRWRGGGRRSALDLWRVMACSAACQRPLNPARSAAASVSEKLSGEYVPGPVLEVGGGGGGGGGADLRDGDAGSDRTGIYPQTFTNSPANREVQRRFARRPEVVSRRLAVS